MQPGQTNNPNGRPKGSLNKRNQEIYELAEELGFSPIKIKMLLAMKRFDELGYSPAEIEVITPQEKLEIQGKNANDLLPYMCGKRKPVDSEGNDNTDPVTSFIEAISGLKQS